MSVYLFIRVLWEQIRDLMLLEIKPGLVSTLQVRLIPQKANLRSRPKPYVTIFELLLPKILRPNASDRNEKSLVRS